VLENILREEKFPVIYNTSIRKGSGRYTPAIISSLGVGQGKTCIEELHIESMQGCYCSA
jgi:hypothetical protein